MNSETIIETVGQGDYVVKEGDCITSIAVQKGHFWKTIWDDPGNAELKKIRKDPNVLLPGDQVTIPPIVIKYESGATEKRHRFRRLGEPAKLRLQFKQFNKPRANDPVQVDVDGKTVYQGRLDGEGRLEVSIPGLARTAHVLVGEDREQELYVLKLGGVDPVRDIRGARQRLLNLGYPCPQGEHEMDAATGAALTAFQRDHQLPVTGKLDEQTQQSLSNTYTS